MTFYKVICFADKIFVNNVTRAWHFELNAGVISIMNSKNIGNT